MEKPGELQDSSVRFHLICFTFDCLVVYISVCWFWSLELGPQVYESVPKLSVPFPKSLFPAVSGSAHLIPSVFLTLDERKIESPG